MSVMLAEEFPVRLRQLAYRGDWSMNALAYHSKIHLRTLQRYLAGEREPRLRELRAIARAMEISVGELIGDAAVGLSLVEDEALAAAEARELAASEAFGEAETSDTDGSGSFGADGTLGAGDPALAS